MKTLFKHLLIALIGLIGCGTGALGQDYPNKAVRILVGFTPGGIPDLLARAFGPILGETFGQQFVVENRPGAGGTLAAAAVARSPADGYTLLLADSGTIEVAPSVLKALPYDTLRDLTFIGTVGSTPVIFVTSSKSQIRTIKDLIREAKASPGTLNYGSLGVGSFHQITFEAFNAAAAGVKLTQIPFKGGPLALAGLLSGDVHVIVTAFNTVNAQRQAGTINVLAVSSLARYPFMPDVPSVAEDIKGFDFATDLGFQAPAGLPPAVLAKLSKAIKAALETPEMQEKFKKFALILSWSTPEAYSESVRRNLKKYGQIVKTANIEAN